MVKNNSFVKLLKKYTNIDIDFIDTFFKNFKIDEELNFYIFDVDASKYLGIKINSLRERLQNKKTVHKQFIENVDYIKVKTGKTSGITYMLNYSCFEKLAMSGNSDKSEIIREYFVKLRLFMFENQNNIYQAMQNKETLKKYSRYESIYFFAGDERIILKNGKPNNIINKLNNYNIGRITDDINLKYFVIIKNNILIKKFINECFKHKKTSTNKEIISIASENIKKIIDDIYCKHTSKKENEELYEELSELLGLYSYVKGKVNIKPFIIIGGNLV